VARARENVGSSVVQKSEIQCYNCKEFRHVARECQKPKRANDAAYHREKMLLCKQGEARIQLNAEQADWRDDTDDDELEDQELEAHYIFFIISSIAVQTLGSGISNLLAVGTTFTGSGNLYYQWELSPGSTDIEKITRKPDKKGHENEKSTQEPGIIKKSQPKSTLVNIGQLTS
nr:hypothetical protein [Tanacetum cinerariifolium]